MKAWLVAHVRRLLFAPMGEQCPVCKKYFWSLQYYEAQQFSAWFCPSCVKAIKAIEHKRIPESSCEYRAYHWVRTNTYMKLIGYRTVSNKEVRCD